MNTLIWRKTKLSKKTNKKKNGTTIQNNNPLTTLRLLEGCCSINMAIMLIDVVRRCCAHK